jgi:hypothetical protein
MSLFQFRRRFVFFLERHFIKGPQYQLFFVLAFIGLLALLGGILLWPVAESDESFGDAVWWAFLRLTDPGYLGDDQGIWRRLVSTIFTIAGYVVFLGSLVAIITTWLNRKIRWLEQGLSPVSLKNHIVILGWTNRTLPIASELFLSEGRMHRFLRKRGSRRFRLVILAEEVGPEIVQQIKDHPFLQHEVDEIILRSGQPIDFEHLQRVNAREAAAIVIPADMDSTQELLSPDVRTIKALLTLQSQTADLPADERPYVVAEIQEESKGAAARRAYEGAMEVISSDATMGRLAAQVLRHPKLSWVYSQLLSQNITSNIFVRPYPNGAGQPIKSLRWAFPKAIVMGLVRPEGTSFRPLLNVEGDTVMQTGDRLVLLARNAFDLSETNVRQQQKAQGESPPARPSSTTQAPPRPVNVLILGWNAFIPQLLQSLTTHRSISYSVTIVALRPVAERTHQLQLQVPEVEKLSITQVFADYMREEEMQQLQPENYNKVLLAGTDRLSSEEEVDARTLVGLVLLKQLLADQARQPQIIVQLADPANSSLLQRFQVDLLTTPLVLSHIMAQVALRPELHSIYHELFSMAGAEIRLKAVREQEVMEGHFTFIELARRFRKEKATLLGLVRPASATGLHPSFWVPETLSQRVPIKGGESWVLLTS